MRIEGQDEFGKWEAIGYYFNAEGGISFWFKKDYFDKIVAGQTGDKDKIYFEGRLTNQKNYEGKWYHQKYEFN